MSASTPHPDPTPGPVPSGLSSSLEERAATLSRMADSMARRWRQGERPVVEDYLARHPELRERPETALGLIYEEICLRQEHGEAGASATVLARFPQWRQQLEVLLAFHQLLAPASGDPGPHFPEAGETLGDLRLLAELGRGAQGRVFLATQPALGDRHVTVKLTPRQGQEHLSLARLQHTHIVPLYSARDDEERGLRVLCMPYFGGTTLSRILEALRPVPLPQRRGKHLLDVLDRACAASPIKVPTQGPARAFLAGASHVQAVCWIGAHLADALAYAHERGLVHLDLKPSNVLLTADGLPMLLDFHLAREPIQAGAPAADWLGGTPAYMSPEQRAGVEAVQRGGAVPAIDARSDLYSLGLVLFEALGGSLPLPAQESPARALRRLPGVSGGLANILARCLEHDPKRRYGSARALAADLARHLKDLPLLEVRTPLPERCAKWRRRSPHSLGRWAGALLILGTVIVTAFYGLRYRQEKRDWEAQQSAYEQERAAGKRRQLVQQLHALADRVRGLWGVDQLPTAGLDALEASCAAAWERRQEVLAGLAPSSSGRAEEEQVRRDLLDLVLLWPDLRVRRAPAALRESRRREALAVLAQAEEGGLGASLVLYHQRRRLAEELGLAELAEESTRQAAALAPRTAWEHYALGRLRLRAGDLAGASSCLREAVRLDPKGGWPHFYLGVCAYRRGEHEDAVLAFTTASAAAETQPSVCLYNRALAYERWGRPDRALLDYDEALRLDGTFAPAALNRAVLHYKAGNHAEALADLAWAERYGASAALVLYNRALIRCATGDRDGALACLEGALAQEPGHEPARAFLRQLRGEKPAP